MSQVLKSQNMRVEKALFFGWGVKHVQLVEKAFSGIRVNMFCQIFGFIVRSKGALTSIS